MKVPSPVTASSTGGTDQPRFLKLQAFDKHSVLAVDSMTFHFFAVQALEWGGGSSLLKEFSQHYDSTS